MDLSVDELDWVSKNGPTSNSGINHKVWWWRQTSGYLPSFGASPPLQLAQNSTALWQRLQLSASGLPTDTLDIAQRLSQTSQSRGWPRHLWTGAWKR